MIPERLSYSAATKFDQCPRAWAFKYVEKRPTPPSFATALGSFVHSVLELVMADEPEERTVDQMRAHAATVWGSPENAERLEQLGPLFRSPDGIGRLRATAWWMLKRWREVIEDPTAIDVVGLEARYSVEIGGVPFVGLVDRLDREGGALVVVDYKTGKPRDTIQGFLYAAAVEAATGELPTCVRMVYLRHRTSERLVTGRSVSQAVLALRATWDRILVAVEAQRFPTKVGPLCEWCEHVEVCAPGQAQVRARLRAGRVRPDAPALVTLRLPTPGATAV